MTKYQKAHRHNKSTSSRLFLHPSPPRYSHLKRSRMKEKWFGEFLPNGPKSAPGGQKNGPNFTGWLEITTSAAPSHLSSPWMVRVCANRGPATLIRPLFKWSLPISCHFLFYLNAFVYHRFAWIHRQLELSVVNLTTILSSHEKSFPLSLSKHL